MANGKKQELLEQGVTLFGWNRVLPCAAVFSRNGICNTGKPCRLCFCDRSRHVPEGHNDTGNVYRNPLPERRSRNLDQQQEKTVRRSAGPARDALSPRPASADGGCQGCSANDGGRLPLSVLRVCDAKGRTRQVARLPVGSGGRDQGSPLIDGGGRLS